NSLRGNPILETCATTLPQPCKSPSCPWLPASKSGWKSAGNCPRTSCSVENSFRQLDGLTFADALKELVQLLYNALCLGAASQWGNYSRSELERVVRRQLPRRTQFSLGSCRHDRFHNDAILPQRSSRNMTD